MDHKIASERIASAFEAGIAPWSRSTRLGLTCGLPVDAATGQPIRGVNTWLLELAAIEGRFRNRFWATRWQWGDLGGVIVRGEGTPIIADGEDGQTKGELVLYNVEQVELRRGAPVAALERFWVAPPTFPDYKLAQRLLDATGARVVPGDQCLCIVHANSQLDHIIMPPQEDFFGGLPEWWSVMFHELIHWVILGRSRFGWYGDESRGELIAELGAAELTTHCGIPMSHDLESNGDHVGAWVRGTREDLWYFESPCDLAWMAAQHVANFSRWEMPA
jgi:antirestriction protein ArdC